VQFAGKVVSVIGCGAIGSQVARLAHAFGCELRLVDILAKHELARQVGGGQVSLEDALKVSDFVTLHVPLTPRTVGMICEKTLALMKPGAFLVNTSRGEIVNEKDLKAFLKAKKLGGAALDVYCDEPHIDWELAGFDNVVATPHIGGGSVEAMAAMGLAAIENLINHLGGQDD
jgi:phosphoglycerate dehydrogenase-like enzyme